LHGVAFQYRPTGYEIGARASDGTLIPIEVKSKREETVCTAKTVGASLKDAKGQLPEESEYGVIALRVPAYWMFAMNQPLILAGVAHCLRTTSRVGAVVIVWEEHDINQFGGLGMDMSWSHRRQGLFPADIDAVLHDFTATTDGSARWPSLASVLTGWTRAR